MITDQTEIIKSALAGCFDRVLDLFDMINMPEHRGETLCFVGNDGYKLGEAAADGSGGASGTAEVTYLIKALSKRGMSAAELSELFDSKAVPALGGCGLNIVGLKRGPCAYSREQNAYSVSAELTVGSEFSSETAPPEIEVSVSGTQIAGIRSFELAGVAKTGETATFGGGIRTRIIGRRPLRVILRGNASESGAAALYSSLSKLLGTVQSQISVGGEVFDQMALTDLSVVSEIGKSSEIRAEFTEVNES